MTMTKKRKKKKQTDDFCVRRVCVGKFFRQTPKTLTVVMLAPFRMRVLARTALARHVGVYTRPCLRFVSTKTVTIVPVASTPTTLPLAEKEKGAFWERWASYGRRAKPWLWVLGAAAGVAYCYKTYARDERTGLPLPPLTHVLRAMPAPFQAVVIGSVVMTMAVRLPRTTAWVQRYAMASLYNVCGRRMYWATWTSAFVHAGPLHLACNMLGFVSIGYCMSVALPVLQRSDVSLPCFFLIQAAAAGAQFLVMARTKQPRMLLCVGYAVVTMFALAHPAEKLQILFLPMLSLEACYFWPLVLSIDAVMLARLLVWGKASGVAHAAHLAGALVGALLYPLLVRASASDVATRLRPYHDGITSSAIPGGFNWAPLIASGRALETRGPLANLWSRDQVMLFFDRLHRPERHASDPVPRAVEPWRPHLRHLTRDWPLVKQLLLAHEKTDVSSPKAQPGTEASFSHLAVFSPRAFARSLVAAVMSNSSPVVTAKSADARFFLPFRPETPALVPLGAYLHVDTGTTYHVVGHSLDVETLQARVLYRNAELAAGQTWARPIDGPKGFLTHVTYKTPDAQGNCAGPRFQAQAVASASSS
jgi:membrane associated rhomboid family serine protease